MGSSDVDFFIHSYYEEKLMEELTDRKEKK